MKRRRALPPVVPTPTPWSAPMRSIPGTAVSRVTGWACLCCGVSVTLERRYVSIFLAPKALLVNSHTALVQTAGARCVTQCDILLIDTTLTVLVRVKVPQGTNKAYEANTRRGKKEYSVTNEYIHSNFLRRAFADCQL